MKIKIWELALLMALVLSILWGALLEQGQRELEGKLVRFHILANSDSPEDRALKLYVRDRVWAELRLLFQGEESRAQAEARIAENLDEITNIARQAVADRGENHAVSAHLTRERYPTRAYESFTLPAGVYHSLRLEIGAARGENWWCVVFPPICIQAVAGEFETALEAAGLSEGEIALIREGEEGYAVRFWVLELIDGVRGVFG